MRRTLGGARPQGHRAMQVTSSKGDASVMQPEQRQINWGWKERKKMQGMFLYADMADSHRGPFAWQRRLKSKPWKMASLLLMNFCAITAHVLHTIVAYMVLMAAWPDANHHDEEALLPGKFRSTLYLDVFGWLLNPTGPGPRRSEREAGWMGWDGMGSEQPGSVIAQQENSEAARMMTMKAALGSFNITDMKWPDQRVISMEDIQGSLYDSMIYHPIT
eukprot:s3170_g6.t1